MLRGRFLVVGVQDVSGEIGEQDGHEVCVDETSQGCFDFAVQIFDRHNAMPVV
jgi:hypothetical protein